MNLIGTDISEKEPSMVPPFPDMVWIPGGTYWMGSDNHYSEEAPAHRVHVDGFWMDRFPVTNHLFAQFVAETGYVTQCEQIADANLYPGASPEMLEPASVVFVQPQGPVDLRNPYQWWHYVRGANWRHPQGPESSIEGKAQHPVVHVSWQDVEAFLKWIGKVLPTEAEWEFAARGGLNRQEFAWGSEFVPDGKHLANVWQGEFPWKNESSDGYEGTSPVTAFPENSYGLHDMIGNVWEWTSDWYAPRHPNEKMKACCVPQNPKGAEVELSFDSRPAATRIPRKVMKGGSHLCAPNYCKRYRPAARMAQPIDTSTSHLGFRCIVRGAHGRDL